MSQTRSHILDRFKVNSRDAYFKEAFSRNIGLLTQQDQETLKDARVAIPGLGGVGGSHLIAMVRSGVGRFTISDFDSFEPANVNRQYGASINAFGKTKLETMKEQALAVNPFLEIREFAQGVTPENIDDFLAGVDVVLDGLDFFNFDIRRLVFKQARKKGIHVVTAGPMGFSAALLVFAPDKGMGFDEYFNITRGMTPEQQYLAFAMGLAPRPTHIKYMDLKKVSLESKAGPSLAVACHACSSLAGTLAIQIILKKGRIRAVPNYFQFDPFLMKLRKGRLWMGNKNPLQRLKLQVVKYLLERNKKKFFTDMPPIPPGLQGESISEQTLRFIAAAGVQAPSGDNCQPWQLAINPGQIDLWLDKDRDHSFFNIHQIASIISCGAAVENMRIAAGRLDLKTGLEPLPDPEDDAHMARLTFDAASGAGKANPENALFQQIWKRRTDRQFYSTTPVAPSHLEQIKTETQAAAGVRIHIIEDRKKIKQLGKMVFLADCIRSENQSLHAHLNQMIRFTDQEAYETRDGFPIQNLEAGVMGEVFLKSTRSWSVMNLLNKVGGSKLVALHSYQGMVRSSGIALITTSGMDAAAFIQGGRGLQRAWLTLASLGLSMQPMTAITLFWLRWVLEGPGAFTGSQQKRLNRIWDDFQQLFQDVDFKKNGPVMLFRFGHSNPLRYGTIRRRLNEFIRPK